jgi:hypothetical protein
MSHGELSLCPQQLDPPVARRDRRRPPPPFHIRWSPMMTHQKIAFIPSAMVMQNDRGTNGPGILVTHLASLNSPEVHPHLGNLLHG